MSDEIPKEIEDKLAEMTKDLREYCETHGVPRDYIINGVAWDGEFVRYNALMAGTYKEKHRLRQILDI